MPVDVAEGGDEALARVQAAMEVAVTEAEHAVGGVVE
jgi:hypothetical protein